MNFCQFHAPKMTLSFACPCLRLCRMILFVAPLSLNFQRYRLYRSATIIIMMLLSLTQIQINWCLRRLRITAKSLNETPSNVSELTVMFQLFAMEEQRLVKIHILATLLQKIYRGWKQRQRYLRLRAAEISIARFYRGYAVRHGIGTKVEVFSNLFYILSLGNDYFVNDVMSIDIVKLYILFAVLVC